ncbi:MAG: hypothetical protein G8D80_20105 [gamma proteobacterium symbiont of Ctena orbiculata]
MNNNKSKYRLSPDALYHVCNLGQSDFETTGELEHLSTTIGQNRALEAIQFAIDMPHDGLSIRAPDMKVSI